MKVIYGTRMLVSSLALLSFAGAIVEAFNSPPAGNKLSHHQNVVGTQASKLNAATLAVSFEEDLALTRKIIMDHQERSKTVSKVQFIQQMEEFVTPAEQTNSERVKMETKDVSVPYDAAARLAFEMLEDKSGTTFEAFETQYLANAVALVKSKQPKKGAELEDVPSPVAVSAPNNVQVSISEIQTAAFEDKVIDDSETSSTGVTTKDKTLLGSIVAWVGSIISKN